MRNKLLHAWTVTWSTVCVGALSLRARTPQHALHDTGTGRHGL